MNKLEKLQVKQELLNKKGINGIVLDSIKRGTKIGNDTVYAIGTLNFRKNKVTLLLENEELPSFARDYEYKTELIDNNMVTYIVL